ncbi:hypothetical protein B0H10DRAFT_1952666 [Mycena sp. CBHHK59/15]|nr:hypothetical protein B0H10DRAFT_1952666 [Mycena sp. CBHHK59/15]
MPPKQVAWRQTVDEHEAADRPESWTSSVSSARCVPLPLPPPADAVPFALRAVQIHPALAPGDCLQLDFSFPSSAFRANPQLVPALAEQPACVPPQHEVIIRISSPADGRGLSRFVVVHEPAGQPVTVMDVLVDIQRVFRHFLDESNSPAVVHAAMQPDVSWYRARRIMTVTGYAVGLDHATMTQNIGRERDETPRFVDCLRGHTKFAGLAVIPDQQDPCWQLHLEVPERYERR